jgi:hypothetical protein
MSIFKWCDECQRTKTECDNAHDNCAGSMEREYERERYDAYLEGEDSSLGY